MAEQTEFDFGVDVSVLNKPEDFLELPEEVAKRREEREAAKPEPIVVPEVPGQAKAAVEAEIKAETEEHGANDVSFEYDGETFWVPLIDEWDIEVFEAQRERDFVGIVQSLIGEKQYAKFKSEVDPDRAHGARRKKKRTIKDILAILAAAQKAVGVEPGE